MKAPREGAQSEGFFRTLVENAPDVITVIDAEGTIRFQSPSLQRMLGYSPNALLGQTLSVLMHPEDMKEGSIPGSEMVAPGAVRRVRCRFRHADGTYRFVENVCTNLLDNPDVAGIVVNTFDVTAEKTWESALRDSEGMFRNVAESAYDAIVSADEDGAIVFWNKGAEKMFGYSQDEALGQPLTILMPLRYHSAHTAGVTRRRSGEPPRIMGQSLELEGLRKDGEEFPLELSLAGWQTGDQAFSTGIMRDISERRKAQEMLREREEQLRYHVEHVPAVVFRAEFGSEGRWLYVNPQIEALLGFSPA
ncbi:MAG: PAS domain-containing protein, partial [Actinomycetota bacterium]